ncbi:MAG: hypothetical protein ABI560_03580, partial [Myxococcales bacterium]
HYDELNAQFNDQEQIQWGLPGDIPLVSDFNGDGADDLTVVRPGFMVWYHRALNGQSVSRQYGLPGDKIPR